MDEIKSIAVPVGRKRGGAVKPRPAGHPVPPQDSVVGGTVGAGRRTPTSTIQQAQHKFRVGERLLMRGGGRTWARAETFCNVLALLPNEGGPLRYRVRGEAENFERVIEEIDLDTPG